MRQIPANKPTPDMVKAAREETGLTQREASRAMFGPDSIRTFQNWETGARQMSRASYFLFLLMTDQLTIEQAKHIAST